MRNSMKIAENKDFSIIFAEIRTKKLKNMKKFEPSTLKNFCENFEFGAVRRCANLVDIEKN